MGRHRLPCNDPVLAAKRAREREKQARVASRKRAQAEATAPRVNGAVVFDQVICPRCGDVFRGSRPLHSYADHRATYCPWFDKAERRDHAALVYERQKALSVQHRRLTYVPQVIEPLPALHTGHELFDRARAARRHWPNQAGGQTLAWPIWDDLMSEGVLALLEERDPADAMRAFIRNEPRWLSLDAPQQYLNGHSLLDVLAA